MTHSDVFARVYKGIFPVWKSVGAVGMKEGRLIFYFLMKFEM